MQQRLHPEIDETWKRPSKGRFVYQHGKHGTTIVYDPPPAKIIGRCPFDSLPLFARGTTEIFCKDHRWSLTDQKRRGDGRIVGFSPIQGSLAFSQDALYDSSGNCWELEGAS